MFHNKGKHMQNKHSVYLMDSVYNLNVFGVLLFTILLMPIFYLQIKVLMSYFNVFNLLICILLGSMIFFSLYALRLVRNVNNNYEQAIEKITSSKDTIEIIYYFKNQKQKLLLNKSDIKKFNIDFDASIFGSFGTHRSVNYSIDIEIYTYSTEQCYKINYTCQTRGIIKSIFKIAKYIPNFSYSINENCIPVIAESINNLSQKGNFLNFVEFLKYMFTNSKVSKMAKLETCFWTIVISLLLIDILLPIFNVEIYYKTLPYTGVCFMNIIGPLIIIMIIMKFIIKKKK